jgi:hypothetical protein
MTRLAPAPAAAWLSLCLLSAAILAPDARGEAVEIEGVPFADPLWVGEEPIPLFGLGLLRYRVFFRGYVGGLYLPEGTQASRVLDDIPKALELSYFWAIKGALFAEAADELLARSQTPEAIEALRDRLDQLNRLYRDVAVGDRYRLTYLPEVGLTLSLNGTPLGTIPGADFAAAYFGIWLGDEPLSVSFRDQLLLGR